MRALLFTILVSFNLVACVTGDNDQDVPDELAAGQIDQDMDAVVDPAHVSEQIQPSRKVPAGSTQTKLQTKEQALPAYESDVPAFKQDRDVPGVDGKRVRDEMPTYQQDSNLPADELEQDSDYEQLEQDELHGKVIDENLPAIQRR
jgi:hypothetical protein